MTVPSNRAINAAKGTALGIAMRATILEHVKQQPLTMLQLATMIGCSMKTTNFHVNNLLADGELISIKTKLPQSNKEILMLHNPYGNVKEGGPRRVQVKLWVQHYKRDPLVAALFGPAQKK